MKLIIIRHGETKENKAGIIQGHLPGNLSKLGVNQAKRVALRLKDEKINFIYSSDLVRAFDTTKEISKFHLDIPVELVKDLRERFFGEWQGRSKEELGLTISARVAKTFPKDGETLDELFNRASNFLNKVLLKHYNRTVVFVGHSGINKAMIAVITGKNSEEIKLIEDQYNTGVCMFKIDENKNHKTLCFNCKKHLS